MEPIYLFPSKDCPNGRKKVVSKYDIVFADNVVDAFTSALGTHEQNAAVIDFLFKYYRGITPILTKEKKYRKEVNNHVGVATAQEIVSFYTGYILGEPKTYIRHSNEDDVEKGITLLNEWSRMAGIPSCDIELATWALICGTAYRAVVAEEEHPDETPFKCYALDPRGTFVAYSRVDQKTPVFCATAHTTEAGETEWVVTTPAEYFILVQDQIIASGKNVLGTLPVIEYPANAMRIGVFEPVIPQLNALETLQSTRVDATVQDVDNVLAIIGADPTEKDENGKTVADRLRELKMLVMPAGSDAKYITAPLRQADTQTLYDSIYSSVLTVTGVPNRNGGSSTSDTGQATYLRDGFFAAEQHAKPFVTCFEDAERQFLRAVMAIAKIKQMTTVPVSAIDPKFPRRNAENVLVKAQALKNLIDMGFEPDDALSMVSLVSDPLDVALRNKERIDRVLFKNDSNTSTEATSTDTENTDPLPEVADSKESENESE